jgi:DOPA 4,5-dioxygenase
MADVDAPWHAHIYFTALDQAAAIALRDDFAALRGADGPILFVGTMTTGPAGPHPIPQYEVHFRESSLDQVRAMIVASGLTALVHPLTQDDLADHTTLGQWIGEPVKLDLTTLDPPGVNQGIPRFGVSDF